MAAQTRLVRFSWENNVNFKMDTKSQSCIVFMKEKLDGIGDDMKAE